MRRAPAIVEPGIGEGRSVIIQLGRMMLAAALAPAAAHLEQIGEIGGERDGQAQTAGIDIEVAHGQPLVARSEEHTSELQSLMRISYDVFCLKKKTKKQTTHNK